MKVIIELLLTKLEDIFIISSHRFIPYVIKDLR
jgi:hypothetical protein